MGREGEEVGRAGGLVSASVRECVSERVRECVRACACAQRKYTKAHNDMFDAYHARSSV